jgi:hypothetical protein
MIHVYPEWEADKHELDGTYCECCPEVDWSLPEAVVIHNELVSAESERIVCSIIKARE